MRIRLGHVVFALIIASILNLAIAWLCAYYAIPGYSNTVVMSVDEFERGTELLNERDHDFAVEIWAAIGVKELDCSGPWYIREHYVISENRVSPQVFTSRVDPNYEDKVYDKTDQYISHRQIFDIFYKRLTRIDSGWPMHSFRGFANSDVKKIIVLGNSRPAPIQMPPKLNVIAIERSIGISSVTRHLPYMPIWFGLIVNTLIYAIVIVAIMWMLIALRSKMRLRRKLCPNCKYPIGVSDVCTECGSPLPVSN